jgi:hypothetical protein
VSLYTIFEIRMTKSELRQLIREELRTMLTEQASQWWLKPAEAEVDAHLLPAEVHEGVCEGDGCLDEKSVPQPYNRKTSRKMSKSQVDLRKKIGKAMISNEKTVSKFRKNYKDEWKDYIWAAASSAAFRKSGGEGDDEK